MYFIIFLLFIIIFFSQKILTIEYIEYFENINFNVFLIGDSILQNKLYATPSIEDYLSETINEKHLFFFAEDNTTISSCYSQVNRITTTDNNKSYIFVSIGGNDILNKIVYVDNPTPDILDNIISDYTDFIQSLLLKMDKMNIILLNIYYPTNSYFHKYYKYINKWNQFIKDFSEKNNCKLLDLTQFMNNSNDFSFGIEPSSIGGKKISNHIINYIN
jgi:lysophospholipase L1-like esterase